jgi:hypothetical protein
MEEKKVFPGCQVEAEVEEENKVTEIPDVAFMACPHDRPEELLGELPEEKGDDECED